MDFIDACEDYFHSKSTFYFETIDRPVRVIQDRMDTFKRLRQDHLQTIQNLEHILEQLNDSLRGIRENFLENLSIHIADAKRYLHDSGVSKNDLCRKFTSKNVTDDLHSMQVFFVDLRQRGQFMFDKWLEIKETCVKLWQKILNDEDSLEYYTYRKIDEFLQNITDVEEDLENRFTEVRDKNDLRFVTGNRDNVFVKAMQKLILDLEKYRDGNKLNDEFIR